MVTSKQMILCVVIGNLRLFQLEHVLRQVCEPLAAQRGNLNRVMPVRRDGVPAQRKDSCVHMVISIRVHQSMKPFIFYHAIFSTLECVMRGTAASRTERDA